MYNRKDYYYRKAKEEGRASRASYKLEQIQAKFKVVKKGDRVVDLGCAPGGWLEVLSDLVGPKGLVVGVDLLPLRIKPRENVKYIQGDVRQTEIIEKILDALAPHPVPSPLRGEGRGEGGLSTNAPTHQRTNALDVILSDMAPNTSGVAFKDSYLSYELATMALEVAKKTLREGGNFVVKVFQGKEVERFKKGLCTNFKRVETYIPPATRQSSKELYLIATGFYGSGEK